MKNILFGAFISVIFTLVTAGIAYAQSPIDGFNPDANGNILAIAVQPDGKILMGGTFTTIGAVNRNYIARLNADGTLDMAFNPNAGSEIYSIVVQSDGKILVGGGFTTIGGTTRNRVARLNADGTLDATFNPNANNWVLSIAVQSDGKILIGGAFTTIGGATRNRVARLDANGMTDATFINPNVDHAVYSIAVQSDGKILIGGIFTNVGASARNRIARLNADGTPDPAFNPDADSRVNTIAVQPDGKILVGGYFTNIGGAARNYMARLNADGTADAAFNPNADNWVINITLQPDGKILAGGNFTGIGGQGRNYIARLSTSGTADAAFNPNANNKVHSIAFQPDGKVLLGGEFTTIGGTARNRVARVYSDGLPETTFNPGANDEVYSTALQSDGKILVGGIFTNIGGSDRNRLARFNANGTLDNTFNPDVSSYSVNSIVVQPDGKILVGGSFTSIGGTSRNRIARLNANGTLDLLFNPDANNAVNSIALQADGKILIGGSFTSVGFSTRNRIARLNADGTLDGTFDPGVNNDVYSIALQPDGAILVGGYFTSIGGTPLNNIARLSAGGTVHPFNPDANGAVYSIVKLPDGKVLIGGGFTGVKGGNVNYIARGFIARLNDDGTLDTFNPTANDAVTSLALQADGKILTAGGFTSIGGQTRNRVARLNADGTADATYNPDVNNWVRSIAQQPDGKILVGGNFTIIGGEARNRIARLSNNGAAIQELQANGNTIVRWMRSGAGPELEYVSFESSPDMTAWTALGAGARISGRWEITGLSLPFNTNIYMRAKGNANSGHSNSSVYIIESVRCFYFTPMPAITSISPDNAVAPGSGFTLTVNGSNFISGSVVRWNSSDRATTFVSSTQLTAVIPAGDIAIGGTATVVVYNPSPGGMSNEATFTINNPVPAITSLSPDNKLAGGDGIFPNWFTLTVDGTNFASGSVVRWNGSDRTTSYVSSTQLTTTISDDDIALAGIATVTVFSPAPGGGSSTGAVFTINNRVPVIYGLSPSSAIVGGSGFTLSVYAQGTMDFVSGSVVRWNGTDLATNFVSGSTLTVFIAAGYIATTGTATITVFNPSPGGGVSAGATFYINNPAPSLTTISPSNAIAGGSGFSLTVNGTNFVTGSVVRWNSSDRTTTWVSSTQVTASIPAGDIVTAGTARVTVFNPTSGGGASNGATFTINNPLPAITSLSPANTTVGGPEFTLTVNGSNFVSGSRILWDGNYYFSTTWVSSTQLTASIPSWLIASTGTAAVTVNSPSPGGGTSNEVTFSINNPVPIITSLSPADIPAGNWEFTLTINGSNFVPGSVVRWNGSDRTSTYVSGTQLTASIPAGDIVTAGTATVTVFSPAPVGGISNGLIFTIYTNPVPAITSLSPGNATMGGTGFTLTVTGSDFISGSVVRWNGADRTTTYVSSTQVTAFIPGDLISATGTRTITVFNPTPGGGTSNGVTFAINHPVPSVISISPDIATAGGGWFYLLVNGSNFVSGSVVRWNGTDRTTTYISATQINASIPAGDIGSAGTATVTVFNPAPGGGTSNGITFSIGNPVPSVTSLSPGNVSAGGSGLTLTVNGSGFVSASVIKWNGSNRTTTYISGTQLTASIPAGDIAAAGTATVTVFNPTPGGGTSGGSTLNIIIIAPSITSLSPKNGETGGSEFVLTVNGSNFVSGAVVRWNGSVRTTTYIDGTQLTASIPAADLAVTGTATVTVFNPAPGGGASNGEIFTIVPTSSIPPNQLFAGLYVYPNPTTGTITIEVEVPMVISLTNMLGKIIYTSTINAGRNTLYLSDFPDGVYLLQGTDRKAVRKIKVVKSSH